MKCVETTTLIDNNNKKNQSVKLLIISFIFLQFLVWPVLPIHCSSRGLLLHLITLNDTRTRGRTPLDGESARRRDLYLTTHNIPKRQTAMSPAGFEPESPQAIGRRPTPKTI